MWMQDRIVLLFEYLDNYIEEQMSENLKITQSVLIKTVRKRIERLNHLACSVHSRQRFWHPDVYPEY